MWDPKNMDFKPHNRHHTPVKVPFSQQTDTMWPQRPHPGCLLLQCLETLQDPSVPLAA